MLCFYSGTVLGFHRALVRCRTKFELAFWADFTSSYLVSHCDTPCTWVIPMCAVVIPLVPTRTFSAEKGAECALKPSHQRSMKAYTVHSVPFLREHTFVGQNGRIDGVWKWPEHKQLTSNLWAYPFARNLAQLLSTKNSTHIHHLCWQYRDG